MSQFTFGNIDEDATDGFDLAEMLEQFELAVNSGHSGSTAPSYAVAGTIWRNTIGTPWLINVYDGANWVTMGSLNATTHVFTPYIGGAAMTTLATLAIGHGLENSSGSLTIKIKSGGQLAKSSDGLALALGLTPGVYNGAKITVDAGGNISLVETGGSKTVGEVFTILGTTVPAGALHMNGATGLLRATYPLLWAYASAQGLVAASDGARTQGQFGPGNGTTTFSLPDVRGLFPRFWDDGKGVDTGRAIATYQADDFKAHNHKWSSGGSSGSGNGGALWGNQAQSNATTTSPTTGGAETRPKNIALMACIQAT